MDSACILNEWKNYSIDISIEENFKMSTELKKIKTIFPVFMINNSDCYWKKNQINQKSELKQQSEKEQQIFPSWMNDAQYTQYILILRRNEAKKNSKKHYCPTFSWFSKLCMAWIL